MNQDKRTVGLVVVEFALLLGIAAFVNPMLIRVGLGFVVGLLLVQRALGLTPRPQAAPQLDRRQDFVSRERVALLLGRMREYYTACHLLRSGQISSESAAERVKKIERELNRLLADVMRVSRGEALITEGES